jgi:hypothetical protein
MLNSRAAPGMMIGSAPRSPYAMLDGQITRLLPPTFISISASVQQGMTPLTLRLAGWPPCLAELSNTVPSMSLPS